MIRAGRRVQSADMINIVNALAQTDCSLPAYEVMILLMVLTVCLLMRASRIGLVAAYLFAYRWGWLLFDSTFARTQMGYVYGYLVFGIIALILAVFSMWAPTDNK